MIRQHDLIDKGSRFVKKPDRTLFRLCYSVLAAFFVITFLSACGANGATAEGPELIEPVGGQLETAVVTRGTIESATVYDASIIPETTDYHFDLDGRVVGIYAALGQEVSAGDLLIEIESVDQGQIDALQDELLELGDQWEHERTILELEFALQELAQAEQIHNGAPQSDLDTQDLAVSEAAMRLDQAEERYQLRLSQIETKLAELLADEARLSIIAPNDATVLYLPDVQVGDTIQAYDTVLTLADEASLLIRSEFVSDYYLDSAADVSARIGDQAYSLFVHELDWQVYMTIVMNEGTPYRYYSFIDNIDAAELDTGTYTPVTVVNNRAEDVLYVPVNTIYREGSSNYVYVVEDNEREQRPVELGIRNGSYVVVLEGLEEGERIYVYN